MAALLMPAYPGPEMPPPRPKPSDTPCPHCHEGFVKHHLWQNGRITDQFATERCLFCGGTGKLTRTRKRSGWDEWRETHGTE